MAIRFDERLPCRAQYGGNDLKGIPAFATPNRVLYGSEFPRYLRLIPLSTSAIASHEHNRHSTSLLWCDRTLPNNVSGRREREIERAEPRPIVDLPQQAIPAAFGEVISVQVVFVGAASCGGFHDESQFLHALTAVWCNGNSEELPWR